MSHIAESCLTLCNPTDCTASGSSVHGLSQQEYWSGSPFPSPGGLLGPGIEPVSPALAGGFFTPEPPGKPQYHKLLDLKKVYEKAGPLFSTLSSSELRGADRDAQWNIDFMTNTFSQCQLNRVPYTEYRKKFQCALFDKEHHEVGGSGGGEMRGRVWGAVRDVI